MAKLRPIWIFLILGIGIFIQPSWASSPQVDSLRKALLTQQGEARAHTLYQLGRALGDEDLDQSVSNLQTALALAQQYNDPAFTAKVNFTLGGVQAQRGKHQDALSHSLDALAFFQARKDTSTLVSIYNTLGNSYKEAGLFDLSLRYFLEMLKHLDASDSNGLGRAYNNISNLYFSLREYEQALDYSQRSLEIFRAAKDTNKIVYILNNMSGIFPYEEAERALDTLAVALKLAESSKADTTLLSLVFFNLAYQHSRNGEPQKAWPYLKRARLAHDASRLRYYPPQFLLQESNLYREAGKLDSAELSLKEAIRVADRQNMRPLLLVSYQQLTNFYKDQDQNDSALHYLELSNALKDSLALQEKEDFKAGLEIENEFSNKKKIMEDIERQTAERLRKARLQYWFSIIGLMIVIGALLLYIRVLRKK